MTPSVQLEVARLVDRAVETIDAETADAFLFAFCVSALQHVSPELMSSDFSLDGVAFPDFKKRFRQTGPTDSFPNTKKLSGVRRDLMDNIYQSIQSNNDIDGVAELTSWLRVALEHEGFSSTVVLGIFQDAVERGIAFALKQSMKS